MVSSCNSQEVEEFANALRKAKQRYVVLLGNGFTLDLFGRDNRFRTIAKSKRKTIGKEKSWRRLLKEIVLLHQKDKPSDSNSIYESLLDSKSLSDTEVGMLIKKIAFNNDETLFSKAMEMAIRNIYLYNWPENASVGILDYAWNHHFHILTSNFDSNIERYFYIVRKYNLKWNCIKNDKSGSSSRSKKNDAKALNINRSKLDFWGGSKQYEWHRFIGESVSGNTAQELIHDIWHIHGSINDELFCKRKRKSVLFTFADYANALYFARKQGDMMTGKASRTWLNLFFNCPLIIAGIHFSSQELLLRRLLVARETYLKKMELELEPSFFLYSNEFCSSPKKDSHQEVLDFLTQFGIKGVCFSSFSDIYDFNALKD